MAPRKTTTTKTPNTEDNYFEILKQKELEKKEKERKEFMKTTSVIAAVVVMVVALMGYFSFLQKVPAGNVGVKSYLLGSSKGIDSEELGPGRYWIGWNEELFLFPTFTQNYTWTRDPDERGEEDESISFQTSEGLTVNADVGISYSIIPGKANDIFQKYRKGVSEITDLYLRNMVRDALVTESSVKTVETVYGSGKAELMSNVEKRVRSQVEGIGINIERIYWIGTIRLPEKVIEALNAKIEATQMAAQRQNEVARKKAEADGKIEEARGEAQSLLLKKKAEAEGNLIVSQSLTSELVQYEMAKRWTGELPRMMGSGAVPFINMNLDKPEKKAE